MDHKKFSARELVALAISGIIVAVMVGYWVVQIYGVNQMLKLAAGE